MSGIITKRSWFMQHFLEIKTLGLNLNIYSHSIYQLDVSVSDTSRAKAHVHERTVRITKNNIHHRHRCRIYRALHRWVHFILLYSFMEVENLALVAKRRMYSFEAFRAAVSAKVYQFSLILAVFDVEILQSNKHYIYNMVLMYMYWMYKMFG